jgi:ATP synthase protein I
MCEMKQEDKREFFRALGAVGNIGFTLAAAVVVGLLLGRMLDNVFSTGPWLTVVGIILGMIAGLWSMYKQATLKR